MMWYLQAQMEIHCSHLKDPDQLKYKKKLFM